MPSLYEGFGMPFIEAMRYGVPVIGTSVGGIPEVVPATAGILVPPEDVPALASAISALVEKPARRAVMGDAGEAWSRRYRWTSIIEGLEGDYERALGLRQSPRNEPQRGLAPETLQIPA
jgi:glycosyltransferase involved in cell wall biosynthesis